MVFRLFRVAKELRKELELEEQNGDGGREQAGGVLGDPVEEFPFN